MQMMPAQIPVRGVNNSIENLSKMKSLVEFAVQCADEMACNLATEVQDGTSIIYMFICTLIKPFSNVFPNHHCK